MSEKEEQDQVQEEETQADSKGQELGVFKMLRSWEVDPEASKLPKEERRKYIYSLCDFRLVE